MPWPRPLGPTHLWIPAWLWTRTRHADLASIEASYRNDFAALRQGYNRESRALRRVRLAGDSSEIQRLTAVTADMREQLKAMRETHGI
ncbi:MAG: hypothetical protein IPK27_12480 [Rhodanobacteraceae bacterium]|nr:hypothetical protein [Rhodanobacteraceae bacterium]